MSHSEAIAPQKTYDDRGLLEHIIYRNDKNQLHGVCEFYLHGRIHYRVTYVNGIQHGKAQTYFPHGNIHIDMYYENGLLQGERRIYNEEGDLQKVETYDKGMLHGPSIAFHPNGKPFSETTFHQNLRTGTWSHYNYKGNITKHQEFDHEGQLVYHEVFD
jgi:antitoxin component YwqK of YwqJK toxin-antitoxin module